MDQTPTKVTITEIPPDRPWDKPMTRFMVQQAVTECTNGHHVTYPKLVELFECEREDTVGRELLLYQIEQKYPNRVDELDLTPVQRALF